MKLTAALGRDNVDVITVAYGSGVFDFAQFGVTRVDVIAGGTTLDASNVNFAGDQLSIKFGKFALPAGKYDVRIVLFTPASPAGIEIVTPNTNNCIVLILQ